MQNNNDTEKFYDTYGKNISFEATPEEPARKPFETPEETFRPSPLDVVKKYLAVVVFIALAATFLLVGGVVVLTILGLMLVGFILRTLFGGSSKSSSSFFIIKK